MVYFSHEGGDLETLLKEIRMKYGSQIQISSQKKMAAAGLLQFFSKPKWIIEGYVLENEDQKKQEQERFLENKERILNFSQNHQKKEEALSIQKILVELEDLKKRLPAKAVKEEKTGYISLFMDILIQADLSEELVHFLVEKVNKKASLYDLKNLKVIQEYFMSAIQESILFDESMISEHDMIVFLGPTGIGKSTTIAKIAARYRLQSSSSQKKVHIFTLDNYRVGAKEQMEIYSSIMEIPLTVINDQKELAEMVEKYKQEFILIDTMGRSPNDFRELVKIKETLSPIERKVAPYLVLSATTKKNDMLDIMEQFEMFAYQSVIITKMDETRYWGTILSAVWEKKKRMAYFTDGQMVPQNLQKASWKTLLPFLESIFERGLRSKNIIRKKNE